MTGIQWPAEYQMVILMAGISQDLEDLSQHTRLWAGVLETAVKELQLCRAHQGCSTPASQWHVVAVSTIIGGADDVDKTQYESFSSPTDHDINWNVIIIRKDIASVTLHQWMSRILKVDHREPTVSHPKTKRNTEFLKCVEMK